MWQPWQVWTRLDKNLMRKMLLEVSLFHNHDKFELGIRTWWGKKLLEVSLFQHPSKIIKTGMKVEVQRRTCMITQFNRCCSHSHQHWSFFSWLAGWTLITWKPHYEHRLPAPSSKLYQIWLRHWRGTLYLCAAVQRCGQHPPKGSDTNMTVEAT